MSPFEKGIQRSSIHHCLFYFNIRFFVSIDLHEIKEIGDQRGDYFSSAFFVALLDGWMARCTRMTAVLIVLTRDRGMRW